MKNLLNSIQLKRPKRNFFDLSHAHLTTTNFGYLQPVLCMECVPGDKFKLGCEMLVRVAPMIAPLYGRMDIYLHYFFVPYRLLWAEWEQWITGYNNEDALPVFPYYNVNSGGGNYSRLLDALNFPTPPNAGAVDYRMNAMPLGAYLKICNDYYRDQNQIDDMIPPGTFPLQEGDNTANTALNQIRYRALGHDYFTSALPQAQKGAQVTIPMTGVDVPVYSNRPAGGTSLDGTPDDQALGYVPSANVAIPALGLYADTSQLESATSINDLRRSIKLQEWLEGQARAGSRYTETILNHFGVHSSDARLGRPEYIVGAKSPIMVSEVLNTTGSFDPTDADNASSPVQGNMSGHGIGTVQGKYGSYFCEEHGLIMGIMSVLPRISYSQGVPKLYSKITDPFQYFWPEFANIGEQPITNDEIFLGYNSDDADTFGYTPRYAEYKYMPNRTSCEFKFSLAFWTLNRDFTTLPGLNADFVQCIPAEYQDIFAVTDTEVDKFYVHVLHKISAVRPMPKYGTPSF